MLPTRWRESERSLLSPWRPLMRQLDEMFGEITSLDKDLAKGGDAEFTPVYDIEETPDHYLMSFDIPGVPREDIKLEVVGNRLLVSGERRIEEKNDTKQRRAVERRYGRFDFAFTLPEGVRAEQIEAEYRDGVLNLAVPKPEESKPQKIKIGEGSSKGGFLKNLLGEKHSRGTVEVKGEEKSMAH